MLTGDCQVPTQLEVFVPVDLPNEQAKLSHCLCRSSSMPVPHQRRHHMARGGGKLGGGRRNTPGAVSTSASASSIGSLASSACNTMIALDRNGSHDRLRLSDDITSWRMLGKRATGGTVREYHAHVYQHVGAEDAALRRPTPTTDNRGGKLALL